MPLQVLLHHGDRGGEAVAQRQVAVDGSQLGLDGGRVERLVDAGVDDLVLAVEDPEDRALGDARRLGDLLGADGAALVPQQRDGGGDDRGPPVVGGHRGSAG